MPEVGLASAGPEIKNKSRRIKVNQDESSSNQL